MPKAFQDYFFKTLKAKKHTGDVFQTEKKNQKSVLTTDYGTFAQILKFSASFSFSN